MLGAAAASLGLGLGLLLLAWRLLWPHAWADAAFLVRAWRCSRRLLRGDPRSLAQRFGPLARAQPPGKLFLRYGERSFTYAQAEQESNRMARALQALWRRARAEEEEEKEKEGGPDGLVVALLVGNQPAFVWAWIGLAKLGVVAAFLGTALRRGALLHCLRACEARALLVADGEWIGGRGAAGRVEGERRWGNSGRGVEGELGVPPWPPNPSFQTF